MATQVQFRRGTTTQNNAFTGAVGELTVDTDVKTLRLHDGTTPGGIGIINTQSTQTLLQKTLSTGSVWQGNAVALAYGGTGSALTASAGAVAYSGASGLALTAVGTSGQVLISGGTGSPVWVNTSTLTVGTATTATTATNIAGGSAGQLIIQADTGLSTFITAGASGTFLRSAGAGYAPTWATADVTIGSTVIDLGSSSTSLAGLNILAATGTSHWTLPVGTTAQRPASPAIGMVRYNSTQSTFEGYSSGAWSSLGGVKSVDALTYIIAETSAGASNGDLDFYAENSAGTAAQQVGQWNRSNLKDYTGTLVGTQTTQNVFNTVATTVNAFGAATTLSIGASTGNTTVNNNLTITGNLTVNGTTTTVNSTTLSVDDLNIVLADGAASAAAANGAGLTVAGANATLLYGSASDNWTFNKSLSVTGTITSSSNASVGGTLGVTGASTLAALSATTGSFSSTLSSTGDFSVATNKFTVASASGNTAVAGTLAVTGATTLSSTLGVTGASTLAALSATTGSFSSTLGVTGATTLSSTLGVTGATTLSSTLAVSGLITSSSGISGGPATHTTGSFSSTLGVTGATTLSSTLGVTGATTLAGLSATTGSFSSTLAVTGTSTFTGAITANGGVTGNLTGNVTGNVSGTAKNLTGADAYTNGTDGWWRSNGQAGWYSASYNVGIYATQAGWVQTYNSAGILANAFQQVSDARLKNNIIDSKYGLAEVLQLRSVEYDKQSDGKHDVGLIAQEVESIIPEFVFTSETDGMKSINYAQMVSVLVKAVQELSAEVNVLKAKLGE